MDRGGADTVGGLKRLCKAHEMRMLRQNLDLTEWYRRDIVKFLMALKG